MNETELCDLMEHYMKNERANGEIIEIYIFLIQ